MKFKDSALKRAFKYLFKPINQNYVLLEPHLGLGDSLICIGLVKALSNRYPEKKFYLAVRYPYFHSVAWMIQSLQNVYPLAIPGEREARQFASFLNIDYWQIGIDDVDIKQFDRSFYQQHQVPFERRWSSVIVPSGLLSDELYRQLNPHDNPYILICNTDSSGITYTFKGLHFPGMMIIEVSPVTANIYDWVALTKKASQIHTIDTAFIHFVENVLDQNSEVKLYFHRVRKSPTEFTRRLPWKIVEY